MTELNNIDIMVIAFFVALGCVVYFISEIKYANRMTKNLKRISKEFEPDAPGKITFREAAQGADELAKAMRESAITAEEAAAGFEALARQIRTSETEPTRGDELIEGDEKE